MIARRIILQVYEVFKLGILLLEVHHSKTWKDHKPNCVVCHLSHIDGHINNTLSHISTGLKCVLHGSAKHVVTMVLCDVCFTSWHIECLNPPFQEILVGQ
jgi:hypothetical protein